MDNSNIVEAVGALVYSQNTQRYLFLLRDNTKFSGTWGLVGGKVDTGETVYQALCREIQEEIGVLGFNKVVPIEKFTSPNKKFIYHTFLAIAPNEFVPKLNEEHRGYCWVALEDHPKPLHPGVWKTFSFNSIVDKLKTIELINPPQLQSHDR